MKIVTLVENTPGVCGCEGEHGLSFYVETARHKLLVDCGQSDMLLRNAERMQIDLTQVDTVVLSHGHYDHTGGVLPFAAINPHAKIYASACADGDYYSAVGGDHYIGMDQRIPDLPGYIPVEGELHIDEELFLFSNITGGKFPPRGNLHLKEKVNGELIQDRFAHEQCLVVQQEGKHILMSGCAHHGILNILDRYHDFFDRDPALVISGFHMMQKNGYTEEDLAVVRATAQELKKTDSIYFTGHCTGPEPCDVLREILGEQLQILHSGMIISEMAGKGER